MSKFFQNRFRKGSASGQNADRQEGDATKLPSARQPVDTQFDLGTPTAEQGSSLFDGMDFGADDVIETPTSEESPDLTSSALLSDLNFELSPPPPELPVSSSPPLLREEAETAVPPAPLSSDLGSSQKKKTRKAKLPGGVSVPSSSRSTSSTPTLLEASLPPPEGEPVGLSERESSPPKMADTDIRESVEKLIEIMSELEDSRRAGELAIEGRVTELAARCELQGRRRELNQLIGKAEEQEDFITAERLNSELEGTERELRECDVRNSLLDVWNGFYSDVMKGYRREAGRLEEMSGVRQEAADRLEQEARREDHDYVRRTEEQRRELSLLVEKQDHSERQLGLDREHVQRQQQILTDDVTARTSQLLQQRVELETRVDGLGEEIHELERKLSRLKSNREEGLSDLRELEERLGAVYQSVQEEEKRLSQEAAAVGFQGEELEIQEKEISEKRMQFSALEERYRAASRSLKDKIERLKHAPLLVERIHSLEREPQGYQEELEAVLFAQLEEAESSKQSVNVCNLSADIDQLSVCRQACQEELSILEWGLSKGEDKLRQLDSVKKGLTQVKKYKEARETAEERKRVSGKQEQLKLDIEAKTEESLELSRDFEEKCAALHSARAELATAEELGDSNVLKCLQELTSNLGKGEQLETWDPKRELTQYRLQVFDLYKKEICLKHEWEYVPTVHSVDYNERDNLGNTSGTAEEKIDTTGNSKAYLTDELPEDIEAVGSAIEESSLN